MLHLRVLCQAEQTDQVLELLHAEAGAAHLVVLRGASVAPPGDLVSADLARESVDGVLEALCGLGVDHSGGITLEELDTTVSDAADAAERAAPGDGVDAVIWEELLARTGEEAQLSGTFLTFLTIACLLASIGVVENSAITIVGAMVVGPEFGPLAALALGLVGRRWDLVRRAGLALSVGFLIAMVVTAVFAGLGRAVGAIDAGALHHDNAVAFIYQIGVNSLLVALLAGAAGMLSITSGRAATLVGVFISVTTVPAAGYAVLAAVLGEWSQCGGAVAQLFINMAGIVIAAALLLLVRRVRRRSALGSTTLGSRPLSSG
ncbi:MAG: DUF389 domain-containing protein [Sciscionella sp.]